MDKATQTTKPHSLWIPLSLLTGFWLLLQIGLFLPVARFLLKAGSLGEAYLKIPWSVYPAILVYIAIHLLLWFLVIAAIIWLSKKWRTLLALNESQQFYSAIALWGVFILTLIMSNQYFFPRSLFADFSRSFMPFLILIPGMVVGTLILMVAIVGACGHAFYQLSRLYKMALLLVVAAITILIAKNHMRPVVPYSGPQPNIIIIGLDSLRPDHVDYYGNKKNLTPSLDKFLASSVNFRNTRTTLGRTFPAWVSILTGDYPKTNGARYDLIPLSRIDRAASMAKTFQRLGYETVYATDEKRFSNIDDSFGFDRLIGPKIGFNDFLLGNANDFPLTNLITNLRLGRWLFPYNYANRGANKTYYPFSFTQWLADFLGRTHKKPLFLNIHLCLSHWPYVWAGSRAYSFPFHDFKEVRQAFNISVRHMDHQFENVMQHLQRNQLLHNAIVIVVSDHGESLEFPGDRLTDPKNYHGIPGQPSPFKRYLEKKNSPINKSNGHGADLLSPSQNQVVMAFRRYGNSHYPNKNIFSPTSLIDIKPTLFNLLSLPKPASDGISLKPYLIDSSMNRQSPRSIFMESGFAPDAIVLVNPNFKKLVQVGIQYYTVNPKDGRVYMKDEFGKEIIRTKQRAIFYNGWVLATYPTDNGIIPVLMNLKTKQWTDQPNSKWAAQTPFNQLWQTLKKFYDKEIPNHL